VRTTVELPVDLLRAAKARSAESGESLKSFLTRAVAAELETFEKRPRPRGRVTLPLFGGSGPRVRPTSASLERALADDDAAATSPRVPSKSRRRGQSS
jgi:hypothetical protein